MNSSRRNAIILILIVLGGIAYIWPKLSFNEEELRLPDIVKSPDSNSKVIVGTPFALTLNDKKLSTADSIVIFLDGKRIKALVNEYKIDVDTKNLPLGYHKLGVVVYRNKRKEVEVPFIVVSDMSK